MASTAVSAQGSTFAIGTGTGSAKTITAVQVGNPTILTAAAHGFVNGDVLNLAALTGADAALLNGLTISARSTTPNTFAVHVDTTGKTITAGAGTATPNTFTAIANLKDYSGLDGAAVEIDVTNLDSTAKEYRLGLVMGGQFTINIDYNSASAGHIALRQKQISGAVSNFKLTLPDATVVTFQGLVKKFNVAGAVDGIVKTAVDITITGPVSGL